MPWAAADDDAAAQVYGFLVGGIVFLASIAGVFAFTHGLGNDPAPADQAAQDVDAASLAAVLAGDAGAGWASPDTLARLGLADATAAGLDPEHLDLLNNATLSALPNGLVEYDEARVALGLDGEAGFRLDVVALDFEAALEQHDFTSTKALYIGDFGSLSPITLGMGQGNVSNANARLNESMAANTDLERDVVGAIGVEFDNTVHLTPSKPVIDVTVSTSPTVTEPLLDHLDLTVWDGDVLYDDKQYLDAVLPGKLSGGGYDLLILGSGIQHSTLTSNAVKSAVDTFVRSGGTLMVFGSPGANYNWMQPIMDVSAASVSGPVTAPDGDHPILATPWDLDWSAYPTGDLGWTIGIPADFVDVLMQGGKPVVAVSRDGAIGSGNVFLSSIQPRAVAEQVGPEEAANYMFNMLLYDRGTMEDPTLQFGPDPPAGVPVSSAVRTTVVAQDGVEVPVRIELLAWETP